MIKNKAGQTITCPMFNFDNVAYTTGPVTIWITGDGGTQTVGSVSSGACTHEGNGVWSYAPSQAETNFDHIAFTFIASGAQNGGIQVFTRTSVWDDLLTSISVTASIGKLLKDNLTTATSTLATTSGLNSIAAGMLLYPSCPAFAERPDAGTRAYYIDIYTSNLANAQVTPAAISVSAVNSTGTSRNSRLTSTTPTTVSTGHYRATYNSTYTDDPFEQIILTFSVTHPTNANTAKAGCVMTVIDSKMSLAYKGIIDTIAIDAARLTSGRAGYIDQIPTIATDADLAKTRTADIQARIPAALTTTNGHMKVSVESIQNDTQSATDFKDFVDVAYDPTTDVVRADLRRVDGVVLATHTNGYIPSEDWTLAYSGLIDAIGGATSIEIPAPANGQDDMFNEMMLVIVNNFGWKQARTVTDWDQAAALLTFDQAMTISWSSSHKFRIYAVPHKHKINYDKILTLETALTNVQGTSFATGTDSLRQISQRNVYQADINLVRDTSTDEWTVQWFKNDSPVTSGITSPTIQIIKRSDGTNLVAPTAMTQVGSTGAYKYDGTTTNRILDGDNYVIHVAATIDSGSRTWRKVVGRDDL
jgi:hypothetical protein